MANKITNTDNYVAIANAIRSKNGSSDTYTPAQMAAAIEAIPSGGGGDDELLALIVERTRPYSKDTIDLSGLDISSIGAYAFNYLRPESSPGYDKNVKIKLPLTLTSIGQSAFAICNISEINLEDFGKTATFTIGQYAFKGEGSHYAKIQSLVLNRYMDVRNYAFQNCLDLLSVSGEANYIAGNYVFQGCTSLKSVNLPNWAQTNHYGLFDGCSNLEEIRLKSALTLGLYVFTDRGDAFPKLKLVDYGQIQQGVATLSANETIKLAVYRYPTKMVDCANLATVGKATSPIRSGTGNILVPRDLIATYQSGTNWSTVYAAGTKFLALEDYTVDGTTTGDLDDAKIAPLIA